MSIYVEYDELAKLVSMNQFSGEEVVLHCEFVFFWKPPNTFGQWTESLFAVDDEIYSCAEQFMMAEKARLFGNNLIRERILATDSPRSHKQLARQVSGFKQQVWDENREGIVFHGNLAKFTQNTEMGKELVQTGNRALVEASPFDKTWGIGLRADDPRALQPAKWKGLNLLGKVLERVRDELINSNPDTQSNSSVGDTNIK